MLNWLLSVLGWFRRFLLALVVLLSVGFSLAEDTDAATVLSGLGKNAETQVKDYGSALTLVIVAFVGLVLFGMIAYFLMNRIDSSKD
jgi:heme/copper-type cytochrome/quinol oxidase subunit 2